VVSEKVPARIRLLRALRHISRKVFHELVIMFVHGRGTHTDSSSVADASRIPDPVGLANPAPVNRAGGVPTTGGMK
jgi:hypothetical protein